MSDLDLEEQERNSDPLDAASRREMQERDSLIETARRAVPPKPTGFCFYCAEPVEEERRFCNKDCAEDYETEKRLRARQGAR